jgi:hypothetical protein
MAKRSSRIQVVSKDLTTLKTGETGCFLWNESNGNTFGALAGLQTLSEVGHSGPHRFVFKTNKA